MYDLIQHTVILLNKYNNKNAQTPTHAEQCKLQSNTYGNIADVLRQRERDVDWYDVEKDGKT